MSKTNTDYRLILGTIAEEQPVEKEAVVRLAEQNSTFPFGGYRADKVIEDLKRRGEIYQTDRGLKRT